MTTTGATDPERGGDVVGGKKKIHIYLTGQGSGWAAYDNIQVDGEAVWKRTGRYYTFHPELSWGNYPSGL